jgi:heme A synthase
MKDRLLTSDPPRWLHGLAVLTVLLTLPLLFLGAGVTSHGVGMVDPKGFRPPWEIVNGLLQHSGLDWRLEYGHRTFGFLVGLCGIGLAVGCWFFDARGWMGWIGLLALAMICLQGALGAFRVDHHAQHGRTFALIHGIFAQLVVAVLVSAALFTSRAWTTTPSEPASPALQRCAMFTLLVVLGQLVLGGIVRHQPDSLLGPRGHLLGAFVVSGAVVCVLILIRTSDLRERLHWARLALMALLSLQLLLGVESWLAKFYVPQADLPQIAPVPMHAEWVRTVHYLVGTLLFSTTVVVALITHRRAIHVTEASLLSPSAKKCGELEGAL